MASRVRFTVTKPIEIELGIVLPHGAYWGVMEEEGKPRYWLELSREQLARIGQKDAVGRRIITCDLTAFVQDGRIEVSET